MNWYGFCKTSQSAPQSTPQISISTDAYEKSVLRRAQELFDWRESQKQKLSSFQLNMPMIQQVLSSVGYDRMSLLVQSLESKDVAMIQEAWWSVTQFERQVAKTKGWDAARQINEVTKHIREYMSQVRNSSIEYEPWTMEDMQNDIQQVIAQTKNNAAKIMQVVSAAVSRIPQYKGSPILIEIPEVYKENSWTDPIDSATIEVGSSKDGYNPLFSIFEIQENGSAQIDDVGEAGDSDFFSNPSVQSDYFALISELRKPGSTSGPGKILTLYTARPVKDRQLYIDAKQIPSNIFLTSNYASAGGLAIDLSGTDPRRDVWRVRISDKYLIQTLEGSERQYQVVGDGWVPVSSMDLIDPGDDIQKTSQVASNDIIIESHEYANEDRSSGTQGVVDAYDSKAKIQVGYLHYSIYNDKIDIDNIEVIPQYQRQNIASRMVQKLLEEYPHISLMPQITTQQGSYLFRSLRERGIIASSWYKKYRGT